MIQRSFAALALVACAPFYHAHAALTPLAGNSLLTAYTHSTADEIISYDWAGSSLYYMTQPGFPGVDVWRANGSSPVSYYSNASNYAGASVVTIGSYIYFNDSAPNYDQLIHKINPASTPGSTVISTASNYLLTGHQGDLFVSGFGDSGSDLFYSDLNTSGDVVAGSTKSLGTTGGNSGPMAFDLAGNLYYADGYAGSNIYKFSAAEVASAVATNGTKLTVTGHLWLDFSTAYAAGGGASSMTFDAAGNLLVSLTDFNGPSFVAKFDTTPSGTYSGSTQKILSDTGRIGELRNRDGQVYISSGNAIYQVVPEPGSLGLLLVAAGSLACRRLRRARGAALALVAGGVALGSPAAGAGSYSSALQNTTANAPDAGIPGFVGSAGAGVVAGNVVNPLFVGWATSVMQYAPAAGVSSAYANPANALGPVTGDNSSIVSLGDLPASSGGTRPAAGFLTLGFSLAITNGPGADFAAFENGFLSDGSSGVKGQIFGELGYVEASTDGLNFARFPSISLTSAPVGSYGTIDPTNVTNLVGKHVNSGGNSWGTPFDLQSLSQDQLVLSGIVDLLNIRFLRIVDIPGDGSFFDSASHPIYDPWLTSGSGGVDFEALGVIHQVPEPQAGGWLVLGLGSVLSSRLRAA